mmetsp:Transcript_3614/g.6427  ORF Transcript_3614/g.6427 Transcript_3614/m.6427 type:complete len:217 (-) Transcript_3614:238-888(-)
MSIQIELEIGQLVQVRTVLLYLPNLTAQLHEGRGRRRNQRGPTVHNGSTSFLANPALAGVAVLAEGDVRKVRGPMVFAKYPSSCNITWFHSSVGIRPPSQITIAAGLLVQTNRKLIHVVVHQQRLLCGVVPELGPNANDCCKFSRVKNRDLVLHNLPNWLLLGDKLRPDLDSIIAEHGHTRAGSVDVLRHGPILLVRAALLMFIWGGWMNASLATR